MLSVVLRLVVKIMMVVPVQVSVLARKPNVVLQMQHVETLYVVVVNLVQT